MASGRAGQSVESAVIDAGGALFPVEGGGIGRMGKLGRLGRRARPTRVRGFHLRAFFPPIDVAIHRVGDELALGPLGIPRGVRRTAR
jgi:hypothetical protein